ncbi:MAG TPA: hypothetical protein VHW05_08815 [Phenylobacterium sp.]|jgi:hypothetical protein|nr:hypothetical protein [Phenylobacterium sp.]
MLKGVTVQAIGISEPAPSAAASGAEPPANVAQREDSRRLSLFRLCLLTVTVGIVTGFGVVVFRELIGLIHNVMFIGRPTRRYDANVFTAAAPRRRATCVVGRDFLTPASMRTTLRSARPAR